jgi:hypothetical protein
VREIKSDLKSEVKGLFGWRYERTERKGEEIPARKRKGSTCDYDSLMRHKSFKTGDDGEER